jgi:ribosomal protein S6--L-glutamate ligase
MIIRGNQELKSQYDRLGAGDIYLGAVSSKHSKQTMLIDLLERGVCCLPSALSQVLNSSKVAQSLILQNWMIPQTTVIHRRKDLIDSIPRYARQGIGPVVTKQDHKHCGHGVRRWDHIEALYNYIGFSDSSYPFVIQPYLEKIVDVRVIVVGDFVESYVRQNPYNFRSNVSAGGESRPYPLEPECKQFCRRVMERGKFPYAHIDLMIVDNGAYYLSEISLNGGTKGARINSKELRRKKQDLLLTLANNIPKPEKLEIDDFVIS